MVIPYAVINKISLTPNLLPASPTLPPWPHKVGEEVSEGGRHLGTSFYVESLF